MHGEIPTGSAAATRPANQDATPIRVVIITLDSHLGGVVERARTDLAHDLPGLTLSLHAAADWDSDPDALARAKADIAAGDIVLATMLFMEDHIQAVLPDLQARRDHCDAMVGCIAAGPVIKLTRMGRFSMDGEQKGALALLKKLRGGKSSKPGAPPKSSGSGQMAMLRRIPKILRFIPGTAQDVRAYFLTLQYWLGGSDENIANMVRFLVDRYACGPRAALRGNVVAPAPAEYPETGLYHPALPDRVTDTVDRLPRPDGAVGTIGLLIMRSYVLAGDTAHYDAVIAALESRGYAVRAAFAAGLDARPAVEEFFLDSGATQVDAVVSLTGFSLVGGPAYNDAAAAADLLSRLDVPYLAAHALEFQSMEQWRGSERGLTPLEATMMVAIPEIDGATGPIVFGGRSAARESGQPRAMLPDDERIARLVDRVANLAALRRTARAERRIAVVIFNFPPNAGATGTAAFLDVFASLHNTLHRLAAEGYSVDVPASVDDLRTAILGGNAARHGTDANVHATIPVDDLVRREPHLGEIEAQWGPAPGRHLTDGTGIHILGARFGNVFVGVQPGFGYEGDPMRLLFDGSFAPTHAFTAFYRYLAEDFAAHAVLHFGTHGALEFMPGKQAGMTGACWPDRLIGALPNLYLYAANNPSEGTLAKRRAAATLVSYLTPSLTDAGLYKGLIDLKASLERWRLLDPVNAVETASLAELIQAQAADLDLTDAEPAWSPDAASAEIAALTTRIHEVETALIPHGLHVIGAPPPRHERVDTLVALADAMAAAETCEQAPAVSAVPRSAVEALIDGKAPAAAAKAAGLAGDKVFVGALEALARPANLLAEEAELPAVIRALDGRFIAPAPGGDLLRNPEVLPTGRNIHGFDPYRIPSTFAVLDGARQAERLLERHVADGNTMPRSIALVLWGTDNLKTEGGPIAQALALMGARPRFDSYGRLCGAELMPLETLGRPRIDVVMTLSGIFRDLLPMQTRMLAEAAFLAATADEPAEQNFVRAHALTDAEARGCDLETAALRVFSNADGAYGSNVNQLIDSGAWDDEDELADAFSRRKSFAYGRAGKPMQQAAAMEAALAHVDLAYQNLESVELGITTIDHYFDTLGGIGRAIQRAKGSAAPVYIGDQTRGAGQVRTLAEQVALETRTRTLNPKWYEGMLAHGYEGVRQIEAHVTNTMGWSATTGQVAPWVYSRITETFVLDDDMRERLAKLNPKASARVANRLLEAHERQYWNPDEETLEALRRAGEELEDRLEGINIEVAA